MRTARTAIANASGHESARLSRAPNGLVLRRYPMYHAVPISSGRDPHPTGDDVALLRCALLHGVSFDPGHLFARSPVPGGLAFRVCYSSAPIDRLAVGAARLARALESYRRAPNGGTTR